MQRPVLSVFLSLLFALAACACVASPDADDSTRQGKSEKPKAPLIIRVSGHAEAAPENAVIHFAIVGEGDSLSAAEQEMRKTEQSVADALDKQGIKRKEMQLEQFAATPLQPGGISSTGALKPLGYRVQRQYCVTVPVTSDSLDKALKVADAALGQGGRPVVLADAGYDAYDRRQPSLMEFTIKDAEKLTKQAMADALQRARKLAEQAAAEMGYGPGALKLVNVQASDSSAGLDRYDSSEGRTPLTSPVWQVVKATVSIEAEFDVK